MTRWSERTKECTSILEPLFIYIAVRSKYLLSSWYQKTMSPTPPPQCPLTGRLSDSSSGDEELPSPSPTTTATATVAATPTPVDNVVRAILTQTLDPRPPAKATEPTQTSDYGEPSKPSFLRLTSLRLSKRLKKLLVSTHLKKGKAKAVLPRNPLVYLSDDESKVPPRIVEARGRSRTSRLPRKIKSSPLYELYDDGQGSWVDEFGYIYRAGLDTSRPNLKLSCGGNAGTAPRPSIEHGCHPCRVDSRVPRGSLGIQADGLEEKGTEVPGGDQRFPEGEVAEFVSVSHGISRDGNSCRCLKDECCENDDVSVEILDKVLAAGR
jgi:hypothetical protein